MTQASKRIQQEATRWAVKAQLGPLTPAEAHQLDLWLASDSRHRGAYVRANTLRVTVERIAAVTGGTVPRAAKPSWILAEVFRVHPRFVAATLALIAITTAAGWLVYRLQGRSYVSDIGELRQVALDDGSSMLLNTATKAVVHLDDSSRDIQLARGEALFEVAKDPKRPFIVHAGDITVKAVGTAFSVRNDDTHVDVTVTEGVVELTSNDGTPIQRLAADHRAVVTRHKPLQVQTLDQHETDRQLAWRTGRLEFDGQSLSEAAEEINRHNHRHVIVTNPSLARHPIVGVFRSADADGFAEIAAAALDAEVVKDGDTLRIEPKVAH